MHSLWPDGIKYLIYWYTPLVSLKPPINYKTLSNERQTFTSPSDCVWQKSSMRYSSEKQDSVIRWIQSVGSHSIWSDRTLSCDSAWTLRPLSMFWLSRAIWSVAAENQWSGAMKSVLTLFDWSAPLVSRGDWSDRTTESECGSGLKLYSPMGGRMCLMSLPLPPPPTHPPVWKLRAVIWFHFTIPSFVLLPNSVTHSVLSILLFCACWPILLPFPFFPENSSIFFVKR